MKMSKNHERQENCLGLLAVLCFFAEGCASAPQPTLAQRNIRNVAVFPPQTRVWLQYVGKRQDFPAEAKAAQAELFDLVAGEIRQRGLILKDTRLDERDAADPEQQSPFFSWARTMITAYNSLEAQQKAGFVPMSNTQADATLMKKLARHTQADALILTQAAGFRSSASVTTINAIGNTLGVLATLAGGAGGSLHSSHSAGVRVYLVEGNSGQILWTQVANEKDLEEPQLEKMVRKIFKNFPP